METIDKKPKSNKGGFREGGGRPSGSLGKTTIQAREAIAAFVDNNADRLTGWLDRVAADNPAKAFELFQSVVEYHIPKLARSEMVGLNGGPVKIEHLARTIIDPSE